MNATLNKRKEKNTLKTFKINIGLLIIRSGHKNTSRRE